MGWDSKTLPDKVLRLIPAEQRRRFLRGTAGMTADEALNAARVKSERDLQNLIESYFRVRNIVAIRSRMDKATTTPVGTPDFVLALRSRATAIEVKLPGEELEPEQARMKAAMTAGPNEWNWVTVHSLDEVKALVHKSLGLIG